MEYSINTLPITEHKNYTSTETPQILIAIDFSDQSLLALHQSPRLAKFYNAELTLLYVIDEGTALDKILKKRPDENELKEVQHKLDELAETIGTKHGLKVNTLITKGRIAAEILKAADKISAKLIMMGTYGTINGLQKSIIGANAFKVVRESECPVITIKGSHLQEGCKNIVLPIDLSKESREKVKNAIELGKLYGATIHVVYITESLDKQEAFKLTKQVQHVKGFIEAAGVKCTTEVVTAIKEAGSTAKAIIDYANKNKADLIMIMTQQEGVTKPLFVSDTAQDIINNSDVPVISIVPSIKNNAAGFSPF